MQNLIRLAMGAVSKPASDAQVGNGAESSTPGREHGCSNAVLPLALKYL